MAWVPPALRNRHDLPNHVVGANVGEKAKAWVKDNKRALVAAVVIVGAMVALYLYQKSKVSAVGGAAATASEKASEPVAPALASETVAVAPAPVATVAVPVEVKPGCASEGLPKPANVYQDDGLAGVNEGVEAAAYSAGNVGLPVDYAGSCSGVNPAAVWQSSQLLPASCGQSLEGTSDWSIYAPSNYEVTSFLAAGQNFGQDTVSTTLRNASLDLRPEPAIPQAGCSQVPFGQSSWVDNGINRVDYSHSLVA